MFPAADRAEIAAAVSEILGTGSLTLGPYTRQFEAAFAAAHGARHAAATASGTAALDIALRVAGVQGREVIVPANTFFATAAAVAAAAPPRYSRTSTRPRSRSARRPWPRRSPRTRPPWCWCTSAG